MKETGPHHWECSATLVLKTLEVGWGALPGDEAPRYTEALLVCVSLPLPLPASLPHPISLWRPLCPWGQLNVQFLTHGLGQQVS